MTATSGRHRTANGPVMAPPPTRLVELCACGCRRPRDRENQAYRRECHNKYMKSWRARRKLRPEDYAFVYRILTNTAGMLSQAMLYCQTCHGRAPLCPTCAHRSEEIDQARALAERVAPMARPRKTPASQ